MLFRSLRELDQGAQQLQGIACHSLYTPTDLTVCPGWRAVLPQGTRCAVPVFSHRQLIADPRAIAVVAELLLRP